MGKAWRLVMNQPGPYLVLFVTGLCAGALTALLIL
jgi:hypothetical protein